MSVEELKGQLAQKVIAVFELCDEIMTEEGHVGILDVTTMMFIGALHTACGRVQNVEQLKKEDLVYPLPPLEEIECTLDSIDVVENCDDSGDY